MNTTRQGGRAIGRWILLLLWWPLASAFAGPLDVQGRWVTVAETGVTASVAHVAPTGGHFRFDGTFEVAEPGRHVIDFRNSSVVHRFVHRVYDSAGQLVAELPGGIGSEDGNPFLLRHGREVSLAAGRYRLVSDLESPFYLAQPEPYVDTLGHYRQAIKPGNALVLTCLGVFLGLGIYYTCLAALHRERVHAMYALFILGNLLYNGTALMVFSDLFGWPAFYLISVPILFSNIAYVLFVTGLLGIRADTSPRLHRIGQVVIGVMVAFIAVAAVRPSWSLELDRVGVALFLLYGLSAGVVQVLRGNVLARFYLLANVGFFVSGLSAILLADLNGVYALYVEHLGLVAVTIEVVLLAFVLSYQFGLLRRDKDAALARAEGNLRLACTDSLTSLPNRYALERELALLPSTGSLTFIDLDGLKHYNDEFGHASGDELLRVFAAGFSSRLDGVGILHRLGGDEFAATTRDGRCDEVEHLLADTVEALKGAGFGLTGASSGSVRVFECAQRDQLKHVADSRMYETKRRRRRVRDQDTAAEADS
jgi:diguanylate cyclase (GGDEF)-like protein